VATKERLAAMAASLCAVCSGVMVVKLVVPDPRDRALELRTYVCAECGHSRTYSVDGFSEPDDLSVQAAVEANDTFITALEQIRDRAQDGSIRMIE
jgi:hypothetical protein